MRPARRTVLALSRSCLSLRWLTDGITNGNKPRTVPAMISPCRYHPICPADHCWPAVAGGRGGGACPTGRAGPMGPGLAMRPPGAGSCGHRGPAHAARGKGPGRHLRTGVPPVGNGSGLRCLLGARALSRPNPPSGRMSAAGRSAPPAPRLAWGGWMLAPQPSRNPELTSLPGPASESGAGLCSNIPLIRAMSTANADYPSLIDTA